MLLLAVFSTAIGVYDFSLSDLLDPEGWRASLVLMASRIPRTLAAMLVGLSAGVAGMIMQMLARNRFVTPGTAGTTQAASFGLLMMAMFAPNIAIMGRIGIATLFALAGTALFLFILRQIPLRSPLIVPLLGLMLGSVISAATTFLAYRYDFLQSLSAWTNGDFSRVLRGRYETLWLSGALTAVAYLFADRFTVAGMGEAFAKNLGVHYGRVLAIGLAIVSAVTAVNVVTVGAIPFIGLVVPNLASMMVGDNLRRSIPWVALLGAGFVLACDIVGRLVRFPYEVPISVVVGIVGSALFLWLLLRGSVRVS